MNLFENGEARQKKLPKGRPFLRKRAKFLELLYPRNKTEDIIARHWMRSTAVGTTKIPKKDEDPAVLIIIEVHFYFQKEHALYPVQLCQKQVKIHFSPPARNWTQFRKLLF